LQSYPPDGAQGIAGITLLYFPTTPFYNVPQVAFGAGPPEETFAPDAPCSMERVAAWAEGALGFGLSILSPGPLTCLPNDGDDAGEMLWLSWFFDKFVPAMAVAKKNGPPVVPHLSAVDSACLWALLWKNMIFEKGFSVADLASQKPTILQAQTQWLTAAKLPLGLAGQYEWGRGNGDIVPKFPIDQVIAAKPGMRMKELTPAGTFGLTEVARWPGPSLLGAFAGGAPHAALFDPCPVATFRAGKSNTSAGRPYFFSTCEPCSAGRAAERPLSEKDCLPCAAGTFSLAGAASCSTCLAGHFTSKQGQSACSRCPAGSYQAEPQRTACLACLVGSFSAVTGATTCKLCEAGFYGDRMNQGACDSCPSGLTTASTGSTAAAACACRKNTYHRCFADGCELGAHDPRTTEFCRPCPAGFVCEPPDVSRGAMIENGTRHRKPMAEPGTMGIGEKSYKCIGKSKACPGAFMDSPTADMCSEGGSGVSCAYCLDGYSLEGGRCIKCKGSSKSAGVIVLAVLTLVFCIAIGKSTFPPEPHGTYTQKTIQLKMVWVLITVSATAIFQVMQVFGMFGATVVKWPGASKSMMELPSQAWDLKAFQLSCTGAEAKEFAVTRTLLTNLAPLIPLFVLTMCFILGGFIKREGARYWPDPTAAISNGISLLGTFFVTISNCAINTGFAEFSHPSGDKSLLYFPFILTTDETATKIKVISILGVLVWCVGGMSVVIYILNRLPKRVLDLQFRRSSLAIVIRFRPEMPWWWVVH
jgi:hypothetical protein